MCYSTAASRYDGRVVLVRLGVAEDPGPSPPPPPPSPPSRDAPRRDPSATASGAARNFDIGMEWEEYGEVEPLPEEMNAEIQEASGVLNTLLQGLGGE